MTRLLILVEGQSEEIFVNRILKPHLEARGVFVASPIILWTKRLPSGGGFRGGVSNWSQIKKQLLTLAQDSNAWVTSLLDFYGLPKDVPGYEQALEPRDPYEKVRALQAQMSSEINHERFIPFLAMHEFEAWVFSNPAIVADHFDQPRLMNSISHAVQEGGGPELINHGPTTHPKARLQALVDDYKETSDGPTLMGKIGINGIRTSCPHFASWLDRLEALAPEV